MAHLKHEQVLAKISSNTANSSLKNTKIQNKKTTTTNLTFYLL